MKNIFIVILVLLTTSLHGQVVKIEGRIINENLNPVEYVNVGILGESIGTVSDSLGNFTLFLEKTFFDNTLLISHISYESKEMLVSSMDEEKPLIIKLKSKTVELEEVVVHSFHSSIKQKGRDKVNTKGSVKFSISSTSNQNLGAVIGRKFKFSSRKKHLLEEIRFFG